MRINILNFELTFVDGCFHGKFSTSSIPSNPTSLSAQFIHYNLFYSLKHVSSSCIIRGILGECSLECMDILFFRSFA